MSESRTMFGFHRTECACAECALNCRFIPGYLIPTDLAAIATELGVENLLTFAQAKCALNCRFIPGYLIPTDLAAIAAALGVDNLLTFAQANLLASPGATVLANGELFQIPTLVPARQANGACKFLTAENLCAIHRVSPFGCGYFDVHQPKEEADERSFAGLAAIAQEWKTGGQYARIWMILHAMKRDAPSPIEAKERLKKTLSSCR